MNRPNSARGDSLAASHVLDGLVEAITARVNAGEEVDLAQYAQEYPGYADRLRQMLPTIQALARLGLSVSSQTGANVSDTAAAAPLVGVLGDFRILREVGRGGMGVVYEAEQISLGRRMALKVLPFAGILDERQLTRFRNEARAAASLNHPNVVGVHSVGTERGVHYYAMEFIEGQTLAQVIAERRPSSPLPQAGEGPGVRGSDPTETFRTSPQPAPAESRPPDPAPQDFRSLEDFGSLPPPDPQPLAADHSPADTNREPQAQVSTEKTPRAPEFFRRVADWGIQAAEGLEHAHQLGVVHRDIKPSNLMVNAAGHLWITDFGLALIQADAGITMTGDILGTLRYMSPEQAQGNRRVQDHRSDIYSLGVTLYELLTLRPPFASHDRHALMHEIIDGTPPPLRQFNRSIPRDLETIVLKALATDPQARYATAQQMADDLKRFLADKPIRARRPTLADRITKWSRRHRPVVWSAATVVLLFAVTAGAIFWNGYRRAVALEKDVSEHLAAAAALLEAADYAAAGRELVESRARLETGGYGEGPLAEETERIADVLSAKAQTIERFDQFQKLRHRIHSEMYAVDRAILDQAQTHCRTALDLYDAMASDSWKQQRGFQDLSPERQATLEEGVVELLFVWARLEIGKSDGQPPAELQAGHRRTVDAFSRIQTIHKPIPAVYLWIADSWEALGDKAAATEARAKAEAIRPSTAMDYFVLGEHHAQHGRLDEALASHWQALAQQPDHYLSLLASGVALGELKDYRSAEAMLTGVIAVDPQTVLGYVKRGMSRLGQGKILLAQADFQRAKKLDPELALALIRRAEEYRVNFQFDKALADYSEAIRLDPKAAAYKGRGTVYLFQGDLDTALADCNECVRLEPGSGGAYSLRAEIYRMKGDLPRALADANDGIRLDPKHTPTYLCRGRVYSQRGELNKALADLNEAVHLDPKDGTLRTGRADIYLKLGEREKGLADYNESIRLDPKNVWGYLGLALFYRDNGDPDKALAAFNKAVRIAPQYGLAYTSRAAFHKDRGDFDKALADYNEAIRLSPKIPWAYSERANFHRDRGDLDKALADYSEAVRLAPKEFWGHFQRANFHLDRGDFNKALADCNEALRLEPGHAWVHTVRAWTFHMMGEWDKALADHNESIRLQPRWGQWYLWRGNYYLAKDDFEKAAADFDRAAELDWKESTLDKLRTLARFRLKHYDKALASIAKALELRPDDFRSFAWIPPEQLAKCPDERLRKGLLELADKTIQKTQRKADAYGARAWRGQFLKVLPLRLLRV